MCKAIEKGKSSRKKTFLHFGIPRPNCLWCLISLFWTSIKHPTRKRIYHLSAQNRFVNEPWAKVSPIVRKTRRRRRHFCEFFQASCAIFAFYCENWHKRWMNRRPLNLRGGQLCFLMVFHADLRQISNYLFCAISSRERSACAIFYVFSNYGFTTK